MKRTLAFSLAGLACALLVAGPALGQEVSPIPVDDLNIEEHPVVSLVVTAPEELLGFTLDETSVALFENNDQRQVVVTQLPNDALEVVLLLDTSGSMRDAWADAQSAAIGFVDAMPPTTRVAVMGFGTAPVVATEFSTDPEEIKAGINTLRPRGETALYDALAVALEQFSIGDDVRRTLILLSDGGDTVSITNVVDAIQTLETAEVDFFAIELESFENDSAVLAELARAGGGIVVPAADTQALADIYARIASELVSQYRISYVSESYGPTRVQVLIGNSEAIAVVDEEVEMPPAPVAPVDPVEPVTPATPAPAVITLPDPRPGQLVTIGWLQSDSARLVGIAALAIAVAVSLAYVLYPRPKAVALTNRERLAQRAKKQGPQTTTVLSSASAILTRFAERLVSARGKSDALNRALERAGIMLRPGEFLVLAGAIAVAVFFAGAAAGSPLLGLVGAVLSGLATMAYVKNRQDRRTKAFAEQLEETLLLMSGTLRAGYGLMQAVDAVAREAASPTGDEFRRLIQEVRLGRDLEEALDSVSDRVNNEDFKWVAGAIEIQREVGGDLAEVLDTVAATIRDRNHLKRQVDALAADGKISAVILIILPFFVGAVVAMITPSYISELFTTLPGRVMVGVGLAFMAVGSWWMSKLIKVEF